MSSLGVNQNAASAPGAGTLLAMAQKKVTVTVDGIPVELTLIPKRESKLHRTINGLWFIPDNYMTSFWTCIGSTLGVPDHAADDPDFGEKTWVRRYIITLRHEAKHALRAKRMTLPLYATCYLGPSVTLGLPAVLVTLLILVVTGSLAAAGIGSFLWQPVLWALGGTLLFAPFTAGWAIFRAHDEWDAYFESVVLRGESRIEQIARSLWYNYFYTIAPGITRRHLRKRLSKHKARVSAE